MSRKHHRGIHKLIEADYEVSLSRSHADDREPIQVRAAHEDFPTRYASGNTIGRAIENLLKKTGLA